MFYALSQAFIFVLASLLLFDMAMWYNLLVKLCIACVPRLLYALRKFRLSLSNGRLFGRPLACPCC